LRQLVVAISFTFIAETDATVAVLAITIHAPSATLLMADI
jgi:hypothetical protein